jgi:hypothetical protein
MPSSSSRSTKLALLTANKRENTRERGRDGEKAHTWEKRDGEKAYTREVSTKTDNVERCVGGSGGGRRIE